MTEPELKMEASARMMQRVADLIARAEEFRRTGDDASADVALGKADAIVEKYAIDKAKLDSVKPRDSREQPIVVEVPLPFDHEFWSDLSRALNSVLKTARVKWVRLATGKGKLFGYASDIEYAQLVWASVSLSFASKIDPRWNSSISFDANVKALKEAGMKWYDIRLTANRNGEEVPWPDGKRLLTAYRRECRRLGVEPENHTQRHSAYRANFANSFCDTVSARLWKMREAQEGAKEGSGAELVLRDRSVEIDELLYKMYPHLRPLNAEEQAAYEAQIRKENEEANVREEERRAAMSQAERDAEDRQKAREYAQREKYWEKRWARKEDAAGARAGRRAGAQVNLTAGRNGVNDGSSRQIGN